MLRIGVVGLVGQLAAELAQRRSPASLVVLLRVGSHLVVSRDDAGLFLQNAEHQALPFGEEAGPRQLRAVQSDPVPVGALEHGRGTWEKMRFEASMIGKNENASRLKFDCFTGVVQSVNALPGGERRGLGLPL